MLYKYFITNIKYNIITNNIIVIKYYKGFSCWYIRKMYWDYKRSCWYSTCCPIAAAVIIRKYQLVLTL